MVKMSEIWYSRPRERPLRVLRKRPEPLTVAEVQEHEISGHTNRTEAGVERVLQAEDVQMPMWGDLGLRKVFRSLELTTCGAEHQKRQMRHTTRSQSRTRQMESEPRRQCFVEGAVWFGGSLVIFVRQKVTTSGIVQFWQKSCKAGGYTVGGCAVVMVSLRCWHT